ncbi:MAG: carbon-nitrogen hydrolase family protein [bacterium]|nr:carbon-nitrogen hydrolase family protein [bacterium]
MSAATEGPIRVAVVQAAPVFLDRAASVRKACDLIEEAAAAGARLVAFGENFLPGHPIWFHALPPTSGRSRELAAAMVENALTVPGPESDRLSEAAARAGTMVVIGFVERPDPRVSVVFDSQLVVSPEGELLGVRRKLVPAVGERVFFHPGDGESIRVFDSPWGPVSVLAGGENSNPLLTYAMRSLGARIHVALWPPHFHAPGVMQNVVTITGRAVAYQNTAHVLAAAAASDPEAADRVEAGTAQRANLMAMTEEPASMIYAPRGSVLAGPQRGEGILYADIDPEAGTWAQLVNRQYDRPDLLRLVWGREAGSPSAGPDAGNRGAGESSAGDEDLSPRARLLILDRFGDALDPEETEVLVPYVVQILRRSGKLAERVPATADPRTTPYAAER